MQSLHVYFAAKAFLSEEALCQYLLPTYSVDGDMIHSQFMREVGLERFEPSCIERIVSSDRSPLRRLVDQASYSDQWSHLIPEEISADTAVLVYSPNIVARPTGAKKLRWLAAFNISAK